jgi:hypothetical protein
MGCANQIPGKNVINQVKPADNLKKKKSKQPNIINVNNIVKYKNTGLEEFLEAATEITY